MSVSAFILSLDLLLAAMLLSATSALALTVLLRWIRVPAAVLAKAVVLFPLGAVVWTAIIFMSRLGLPVGSLTLMTGGGSLDLMSRLAVEIWWWVPPVFLLSVPLTLNLVSLQLLASRRPWSLQVRHTGWLALPLQAVVEDAFHLPGALAPVVAALYSLLPTQIVAALIAPALLAGLWWVLMNLWPWKPQPYAPTREDQILEGAIAIGLSPEEAWSRHLKPLQTRRVIATAFAAAAWALSLWVSFGFPGWPPLSQAWIQHLSDSLNSANLMPAILEATWPFGLCILYLWGMSRIFRPRLR